jgi:non-specific serine/threonine protein kinase
MTGRAPKRAARRAVSKRHGQPARRPRAVSSGPPLRFNNLPPQRTSFVGREREIAQIKQLLETTRLLTLTGPGGCGKTRLALQVAADSLEQFPDGVCLVELASLADPAFVPHTVAAALDVPEQPGRPVTDTLADFLRTKKLLLLVDNCEHLHAACQSLIDHLLRECASVRILATSREALGVEGESTYRVPSLRLPDGPQSLPPAQLAEYDAIRLFVDRAALAQLGFTLSERTGRAIAQICQRLDGMPLAIEFAAARVRMLSVEQIAARLDDRFRLLTAARRQILPRLQTLRATMDWSYDLLSQSEQALLRRLSVFAGGWPFEAAEAVCAGDGVEPAAILDLLTQLVDKSLVIAETHAGEARYRLLETVRLYGADKLQSAGEATEVRRRHRDWFMALAEQAEPELRGLRQRLWLDRLEMEHDNLRAAYEWTMTEPGGSREGLRLATALYHFWVAGGHWSEGHEWLEQGFLSSGDVAPSIRPKALANAALFAWRARKDERAIALAEEGLAVCKEVGDRDSGALCLICLSSVASDRGDYEQAKQVAEESLSLCAGLENKYYTCLALIVLGGLARFQGDYDQAIAIHEQAVAVSRDRGYPVWNANALRHLGIDHLRRGVYGRAAEHFKQSLNICKEVGHKWVPVECLHGLASLACVAQQYERAARLSGAATQLRDALGYRSKPADQEFYEQHTATTRARLGEAAFAAAWAEGQTMTLDQAIDYALAWSESVESAQPRRQTRRPDGEILTSREREIAALVAHGRTNRQIARALIISERTADAHVQNILNKLGFNARAQIASWATERGLNADQTPVSGSKGLHRSATPRQGA